jgi:hypothetical protein
MTLSRGDQIEMAPVVVTSLGPTMTTAKLYSLETRSNPSNVEFVWPEDQLVPNLRLETTVLKNASERSRHFFRRRRGDKDTNHLD